MPNYGIGSITAASHASETKDIDKELAPQTAFYKEQVWLENAKLIFRHKKQPQQGYPLTFMSFLPLPNLLDLLQSNFFP
jgi:hypothetical protein